MNVLLIAYNNGDYIHHFPLGLGYLAAMLEKNGHLVDVYSQDLHRWPDDHLTGFLDKRKYDAVGVGVCAGYYQYRRLLSISKAVRAAKRHHHFVIGGQGPSAAPEYFQKITDADAVVVGEVEGVDIFENGILHGDPVNDVDTIPYPARHLFPMHYYKLLRHQNASQDDSVFAVLSGRGCPYRCTFCYRMAPGFRPRKTECIMDEIEELRRDYGATFINFYDELLMTSEKRLVGFCAEIKKHGVRWACSGRLNLATPRVLALMKDAGCVFINYGIEALDDEVLRLMRKQLTVKQIIEGVEATLAVGISPGLNVIFGNVGDTEQTLFKAVKFLMKYDDGAQMRTIRPVTPYPGCELYDRAIQEGKLKNAADFYENKHVNSDLLSVNFTDMTDYAFHNALFVANRVLLQNYHRRKGDEAIAAAEDLYVHRNADFRGFRQT